MDELIAKLEAATGPDRALDYAIWNPDGQPLTASSLNPSPLYTSSLDAALMLMPEGMQFGISGPWHNNVEKRDVWYAEVGECVEDAQGDFAERAGSPAIALCIAALRARQHQAK